MGPKELSFLATRDMYWRLLDGRMVHKFDVHPHTALFFTEKKAILHVYLLVLNTLVVTVNFDVIEYTTTEDDTDLEVCVNITSGSLERNITLQLTSMDGTAQGIHYSYYMH